jgi:sigma-B regulation protein RsbQ
MSGRWADCGDKGRDKDEVNGPPGRVTKQVQAFASVTALVQDQLMPTSPPQPADVTRRNNVQVVGRGEPTLLFAHGFGCDQNMWRYVVPAFQGSHRVVLFDHVGAGQSETSAYDRKKYATLDGYATDILEICHALELTDVVFVGHSVSSMMGVLAANREPDRFKALVLVGPSPRYIDDAGYVGGFSRQDIEGLLGSLDSNYLGWSTSMAPVIMGNAGRPELGQELTNSFCRTDPEIASHFARVTFFADNRQDLASVRVPTLILQCSDDVIAPYAVGDFIHERIPGSQLVVMKATGHCPNLSAPEETVAAIEAFLGFLS